MRNLLVSFMAMICLSASAQYPKGKVLESVKMKSSILGQEVAYTVYLPAGYEADTRTYPVVYLLHGYSDNDNAWVQFGEVNLTADKAIAEREIPPMIIVMPDAKITWYMNDYKGKTRYEDMFFQEFIPFIDAQYRTKASKEFRGIAGLSMGGFGTLLYSFKHPDVFAACAAFSAAVYTDDDVMERLQRSDYGFIDIVGPAKDGKVPEYWLQNSVFNFIATKDKKEIEKVRFYIDCGDDDFLYKGNALLHIALRDKNIAHEFRIRNGAHNWQYWRGNILEGLKFIGVSFCR